MMIKATKEKAAARYTRNYTNKQIRKQIVKDCQFFRMAVLLLILGIVLILTSVARTFIDMHTEHRIPFNNYSEEEDNTVYSVEISEMPEKVCSVYYDLTVGDEHVLAAFLNISQIEGQEVPVKLRGKIRKISVSKSEIRNTIKEYYQKNGYFDTLTEKEYAYYYLDCWKIRFSDELLENHPLGVMFGVTIIIVMLIGTHGTHWHYMFKHFRPFCSGRRYHASEVDALANHPDTVWLANAEVFETPCSLIGLNHGVTVVDYVDVFGVDVKKKTHIQKHRVWTTYRVIIKTTGHKGMLLTETADKAGYRAVVSALEERCTNVERLFLDEEEK